MILRRDFLRMPAGLLGALVAGPVRTPPAGLVLEWTLGQDQDRLEVDYVLRNHTAGDIGIFDAAPEVSDACYVDFEDPVLLLGKLVLSVPPGLQTAGRPVPCAARLAKNDVFRDQLSLPVPVAVNNPYRFALLAGQSPGVRIAATRPRFASAVTLSIGVFAPASRFRFEPTARGGPCAHRVWPPDQAIQAQAIVSTTLRASQPIAVLDFST